MVFYGILDILAAPVFLGLYTSWVSTLSRDELAASVSAVDRGVAERKGPPTGERAEPGRGAEAPVGRSDAHRGT